MGGGFAYSGFITGKGALQALAAAAVITLALFWLVAVTNGQSTQVQTDNQNLIAQVSTLAKDDLIAFQDNRIWLVRNNNGLDIQVVEWVGNSTKTLSVESFVGGAGRFQVVHKTDPYYEKYLVKYIEQ